MAEPVNGGSSNKPPKEMSMEVRLLLAFILMGAVMFVSQYFFKSQAPPPPQKTAQSTPAQPAEPPKETAAPTAPAAARRGEGGSRGSGSRRDLRAEPPSWSSTRACS